MSLVEMAILMVFGLPIAAGCALFVTLACALQRRENAK